MIRFQHVPRQLLPRGIAELAVTGHRSNGCRNYVGTHPIHNPCARERKQPTTTDLLIDDFDFPSFFFMEYEFDLHDVNPILNPGVLSTICQVVVDAFDLSSSGSSSEDETDSDDIDRPIRTRRQFPRKNYACSQQAQMLIHNWHLDPQQKDFHDFRDVYRIPAVFFEEVCTAIMTFYERDANDCTGRAAVPPKLKILSCFFILSTGVSFKHMAKVIGCGEETIRSFYWFFLTIICEKFGPRFITFPQTDADVRRCVETYEDQDLPGCLGSIDCTHIGWVRARSSVRSWYVGKICTFAHLRWYQSCCQAKKECPHWPYRSSWTIPQKSWPSAIAFLGRIRTSQLRGWIRKSIRFDSILCLSITRFLLMYNLVFQKPNLARTSSPTVVTNSGAYFR